MIPLSPKLNCKEKLINFTIPKFYWEESERTVFPLFLLEPAQRVVLFVEQFLHSVQYPQDWSCCGIRLLGKQKTISE